MSDFDNKNGPPRTVDMTGHLKLTYVDPKTVRIASTISAYAYEAEDRMAKLDLFGNLTAGIEGLVVPHARRIGVGIYSVDRAQGVNLRNPSGEAVGNIYDFLAVDTMDKTSGVLRYLRAVDRLNSAGIAMKDHKTDSVFVDQVTGDTTIVDCDKMAEVEGKEQKYAWQYELKGGLGDVLEAFYTRELVGSEQRYPLDNLVPTGIRLILADLGKFSSAGQVVERIEAYLRGESVVNYPNDVRQLGELVSMAEESGVNVDYMKSSIGQEMPATKYDLFEAEIWRRMAMVTGPKEGLR